MKMTIGHSMFFMLVTLIASCSSPEQKIINKMASDNADVRKTAIDSLSKMGSDAVAPLISALNSNVLEIRTGSAEALTNIGAEAVEQLISALQIDDNITRTYTINILAEIGDKRAIAPLARILIFEKDSWEQRELAANGLGQYKSVRAVMALISALSDDHPHVRLGAIRSLRKIGDRQAIEPLIVILGTPGALGHEEEIINTLASFGSDAIKPLMIAFRKKSSYFMQKRAGEALAKMGPEATDSLLVALNDKDSDIRKEAACVLSIKKDRLAVEPLISALEDEVASVKHLVILALGEIGDERAVDPLIHLLNNRDKQTRVMAVCALGKIESDKAREAVISMLWDTNHDVRNAAFASLGNCKDKEAIPGLVRFLYAGKEVAILLDNLGWEPRSASERVHYWLAKEDWVSMEQNCEETEHVLVQDVIEGRNAYEVENAIRTLDKIGREASIQKIAEILTEKSNLYIAQLCMSSQHKSLVRAGTIWFNSAGYRYKK
jgi:HEAT repeat protein